MAERIDDLSGVWRGVLLIAVVGVAAYFAFGTGGNAEGGEGSSTGCERAFEDAADGRIDGDEDFDLDPALRLCGSLAEWRAASGEYPNALDGIDPKTVAENRCLSGQFDSAPICRELGLP